MLCTQSAEYRTYEGVVIPAYAGIQGVPLDWVAARTGMTGNLVFHLCIHIRDTTIKMPNTL
jgi:hypothetical protein